MSKYDPIFIRNKSGFEGPKSGSDKGPKVIRIPHYRKYYEVAKVTMVLYGVHTKMTIFGPKMVISRGKKP